MQLGYTILYVPDVPATLKFYEAAFGLATRFVHECGDYGELETGSTALAFSNHKLMQQLGKNPQAANSAAPCFEIALCTPDVAAALERGRIDAVIGPDAGGTPLFEEGYRVAMAAAHPLAAEAAVAAERIAGEPMIVRRHCEALSEVSRHFTSRGVRPFMAARTTNDDRALALVAAGLAVTGMPECFACDGVALVPLEGCARRRVIGLAAAADSARRVAESRAVATLAAALRG